MADEEISKPGHFRLEDESLEDHELARGFCNRGRSESLRYLSNVDLRKTSPLVVP